MPPHLPQQELPDYYQPGGILSISLAPNHVPLNITVIRAFTPFTMAQAVVVARRGETADGDSTVLSQQLPESFLVKIYDPKFYADRIKRIRPWFLEAENKAAATRRKLGRSRDPDFEPCRHPENEDLPGWEEWYFQNAELQYHAEVAAYERLQVFQGSTIPRYYGTGSLQLPNRSISPHVVLIEFLPDAKSLAHIDPKVVPSSLVQPLLDMVDKFGAFGVAHNDPNPGNILFSPGDHPTRAVIIDFGEAIIREEDEDDSRWTEAVRCCGDVVWIGKRLRWFGVRVDPPLSMQTVTNTDDTIGQASDTN